MKPSAPAPAPQAFALRGPHIALDALLKAAGLAASGGHAKLLIQAGEVRVDGRVETRRSAKLRPGQCVQAAGRRVEIVQPAGAPAGQDEASEPHAQA